MKNIIFLLFTSLLVSSLIVGCGGSSSGGDSDGDKNSAGSVVKIPGGEVSTVIKDPSKPAVKVTPGCEDKDATLPGCKK